MRGTELETAPFELAEDTVFVELFTAPPKPQSDQRSHSKRHHSSRTTERYDARASKKEWTDLETARRASLVDEKTCQIRAQEVPAGTSSSRLETGERRTTDGADIVVDTTEDVPSTDVAGFEKPDPPTC
ncbi:hypothetical protein EJD97_005597 [Solanum chilense]|uniref:Uncharacterized protein n=1 Tax=Solanum chilense TaxID=4083 RepID=A0A6N2BUX8_SOLCI|nr:hypothetical protein EJD97_005597 [Solanum chilense]